MKILMVSVLITPTYFLAEQIGSSSDDLVKAAAYSPINEVNEVSNNPGMLRASVSPVDQQAFINEVVPYAQSTQEKYKVLSSITLAQAILESGWGKSQLAVQGNNLFGIKGKYLGQSVIMPTQEFVNGQMVTVNAEFRKYPTKAESITDHALLFVNGLSWSKDHYKKVVDAKDYIEAANELQKAGYATDPNYALKLIQVVESNNLAKYDVIYDKVTSQKTISERAAVTTTSGHTVWSKPYKVEGVGYVDTAGNYAGKVVDLVSTATTARGTYHQFKYAGKMTGWLDARAFTIYDKLEYDKSFVSRATVTSPVGNGIWSKPYNLEGRVSTGAGTTYANQEVKIEREAKTAHGVYYQFSTNGKVIGWMDKKAFTLHPYDSIISSKQVSLDGQITSDVGNAIWTKAYKLEGTTLVAPASTYRNKDVTINQEVQTQHGTYYRISINGKFIGWIDQKAITLYDKASYNKAVTFDANINKTSGHAVWTQPYRTIGTTLVSSASNYAGKDVQIIREAKTPKGVYYQFKSNNKVIGWMDQRAFLPYDKILTNIKIDKEATIENVTANSIWSHPYFSVGTKYIAGASAYQNKTVKLIREAKTAKGTYYQFSIDGKVIGWLDQKAFKFYNKLESDIVFKASGKITNVTGNAVWSKPYQLQGTTLVSAASVYQNKQVSILRKAKTDRSIYYQFSVNGKVIGWLDQKAFTNVK
nr:GW domain-containing glycosaminoglycan-binding protein [Listeria weihenstephanensis]